MLRKLARLLPLVFNRRSIDLSDAQEKEGCRVLGNSTEVGAKCDF